jgi:hypothetical protein
LLVQLFLVFLLISVSFQNMPEAMLDPQELTNYLHHHEQRIYHFPIANSQKKLTLASSIWLNSPRKVLFPVIYACDVSIELYFCLLRLQGDLQVPCSPGCACRPLAGLQGVIPGLHGGSGHVIHHLA